MAHYELGTKEEQDAIIARYPDTPDFTPKSELRVRLESYGFMYDDGAGTTTLTHDEFPGESFPMSLGPNKSDGNRVWYMVAIRGEQVGFCEPCLIQDAPLYLLSKLREALGPT